MKIRIDVFSHAILVQVNDGHLHKCYDWIMVFDFIRGEDKVIVRNYTGK